MSILDYMSKRIWVVYKIVKYSIRYLAKNGPVDDFSFIEGKN